VDEASSLVPDAQDTFDGPANRVSLDGKMTQIHDDLWLRPTPFRALGLWVGRQLVVVRLPGGGLWVHSPVPWDAGLRAHLAAIGEVRHVMAPNRYHDECLREFQAEYPEAAFHASPGLERVRRDVRFAHQLSDEPHPDWAGVIDQHLIKGMPGHNEVVFLHRASRSLIIADIAFNFGGDVPWFTKTVLRLSQVWGRFAPSRFGRSLMRDRRAVRASIDAILDWDFDRIVVGHGTNIETGGKAALRETFVFLR
jgi:hypothetical protein